jgi:hypothetical protein
MTDFEDLADDSQPEPDADEPAAEPSTGGPMQRLFDGNAQGPATRELQSDYGVPQWLAVTLRGILRVATGTGVPPLFEIAFGASMGALKVARDQDGDGLDLGSDDSGPAASDPTVVENGG